MADDLRLVRQQLTLADGDAFPAGSERWREALCAAAAELNRQDWTVRMPVTDDFVVYAVDLELVDLDRNLAACVPAQRLALLRDRGLVR
ncbi:hypothetical protein EV384_6809 [Micromonospora kangleipakensis]|uniref:Uncharacterized protein n=1 Tax=Micromonospora kangleipakensis TaxID=1077942 RepID=A0A4Q8BKW2_9ACTN|nr:hypothetical protein [Micromonospora kangleipakensis]RZU78059.1 hypothetical protein EV384_6809 [Micromonospora kangleipakensis]